MITNMYPPHHLGGYELACRDAVARWRAHGHTVEVLTSDLRFPHADETDVDEEGVRRDLRIYWRDGKVVSPPLLDRVRMERHNAKALRDALASTRPDVVSLWHMGAVGLSLVTQISSRKIPMVLVIYDDWLVYAAGIDGWTRLFTKRGWARPLAEAIVRVPTTIDLKDAAVCFASDWLRRRAAERSPLDIGDRRGVVYGGIDLDLFNGGEGPRPWRNRLLVAGRIEQRKGVHVAIEALAQLPSDATLDILGPDDADDYVDGLHRRATELGLASRIDWVGPVPRARLAEAFRTTDVFVFPVVWDEPFGMVPLEAMACGAAVIATGTGGSNEFLHHEINCLRVEREDPAGIAAAVQRLASDEALRQAIVAAGRQTAQRFSDHRYYDELEEWHIAAADGFKAGTPKPRITDSR